MKALVNKKYILKKFQGKGGWTYAHIPDIKQDKSFPFGWKKVKGSIDGYPLSKCHLMPMGNGKLFLPVKAEIRKKIKKKEGDYVHIVLYPDTDVLEVPDEMLMCLQDDPIALNFFNSLTESERKFYIDWIYSAKKEETRINRLATAINKLSQKIKRYEKIE